MSRLLDWFPCFYNRTEQNNRRQQTSLRAFSVSVHLRKPYKAQSTLATMSKQHCRSNVRFCRKDEISTQNSFDIVAVFGNKVERSFDIVAKNGNNVEATFDIVAFDNVASTLLLV